MPQRRRVGADPATRAGGARADGMSDPHDRASWCAEAAEGRICGAGASMPRGCSPSDHLPLAPPRAEAAHQYRHAEQRPQFERRHGDR